MAPGYSWDNKKAGHTECDSFGSPAVFFKTRCFPHPFEPELRVGFIGNGFISLLILLITPDNLPVKLLLRLTDNLNLFLYSYLGRKVTTEFER